MFSFTNKAVQNVKDRLKSKIKNGNNIECHCENINKICYIFDSYFCDWNNTRNIKDRTMFVNSLSMTLI